MRCRSLMLGARNAAHIRVVGLTADIAGRYDYRTKMFTHTICQLLFFLKHLEVSNLGRLQLKLQFVCNKRNKFGICGFSLGIADGIAEKSLQCIQIASVPGYFDGMADGTLHAAGGGLEGLRHLGVQHLGDGVGVPYGPPGGLVGCS